jgi:chromosome partitioning protein
VALLDTDVNQQAASFGSKCDIPGLTVVGDVKEDNILAALRKAEAENDVVMVDLPGGSSTLALKAMHRSHFVLVPSQAALPDVKAALKTVAQIDDAQELARSNIARAIIWTRILPGFESRGSRHVRQSLEGEGVPILTASLMERAAFREIHITGKVPRHNDPEGSAAGNVAAVTAELLERLASLKEAA